MTFLHRLFTITELESDDRCIVCGSAASKRSEPPHGAGASTHDLDGSVPEVGLCDACYVEQERARKLGRKTMIAGLVFPLALIVVVAVFTPFGEALLLPAVGFGGLLVSRLFIARVGRQRAEQAPVLYVDGAGSDVLLQLRKRGDVARPMGYRAPATEARDDGVAVKPVRAAVRSALAFVGASLAVFLGTWFSWFAAFPVIVIDDPSGKAAIDLDGQRLPLGPSTWTRRVGWGTHQLAIDGVPERIDVPFGVNLLLSTSETQCYEYRPGRRTTASGLPTLPRYAAGHEIRIDDAETASRTTCPSW